MRLRIPLPIIVWADDGFHCFMSSRLADGATYEGLRISTSEDHNGKVVQMMPDGSEKRPWDFSVTKNVAAIFIAALLVVWMVMSGTAGAGGGLCLHRHHPPHHG